MSDSWKQVHGWLSEAEGAKLQELARGKRVLEIGAYHGRSTVCMAAVATQVVSVDWHMGGDDLGFNDSLPSFLSNIEEHGVRDKVIAVAARHEDVRWLIGDGAFDLVYIDGYHSYEAVERDFLNALDKVKRKTRGDDVIAIHDIGHPKYPDVKRFLDDQVLDYELIDSLAVVRV